MKAILAMDNNKGIGKDNSLPWPKNVFDLRFFKEHTTGKIMIMGHNTYKSFGSKPLPERMHIVITKQPDLYNSENTHSNVVFMSFDVAINTFVNVNNAIIIGGSSIYKAFEPYIDQYYVTEIDGEYECDAYFENSLKFYKKFPFKTLEDGTEVVTYIDEALVDTFD